MKKHLKLLFIGLLGIVLSAGCGGGGGGGGAAAPGGDIAGGDGGGNGDGVIELVYYDGFVVTQRAGVDSNGWSLDQSGRITEFKLQEWSGIPDLRVFRDDGYTVEVLADDWNDTGDYNVACNGEKHLTDGSCWGIELVIDRSAGTYSLSMCGFSAPDCTATSTILGTFQTPWGARFADPGADNPLPDDSATPLVIRGEAKEIFNGLETTTTWELNRHFVYVPTSE